MELGITVRDVVTGFEGVVVGCVYYLTGCNQALVTPPVDKDGKRRESEWFDVQRCQRVGTAKIELDNLLSPGCAEQAPKIPTH